MITPIKKNACFDFEHLIGKNSKYSGASELLEKVAVASNTSSEHSQTLIFLEFS